MRPIDYMASQSSAVPRFQLGDKTQRDELAIRFLALSARYLQLPSATLPADQPVLQTIREE